MHAVGIGPENLPESSKRMLWSQEDLKASRLPSASALLFRVMEAWNTDVGLWHAGNVAAWD